MKVIPSFKGVWLDCCLSLYLEAGKLTVSREVLSGSVMFKEKEVVQISSEGERLLYELSCSWCVKQDKSFRCSLSGC